MSDLRVRVTLTLNGPRTNVNDLTEAVDNGDTEMAADALYDLITDGRIETIDHVEEATL